MRCVYDGSFIPVITAYTSEGVNKSGNSLDIVYIRRLFLKSKFWYATINLLFYHFDCYTSESDLYLNINPFILHTTFRPALLMMLLCTIRHKGLLVEIERKFHNNGVYGPLSPS